MRRWRGAFNFGSNIPKMLTSDSDDDDVLYVREGIPEENTLSFLALPELRGPPVQNLFWAAFVTAISPKLNVYYQNYDFLVDNFINDL